MLNSNPLTAKLFSVQLIDSIVRISRILEFHEPEAPLQVDIPDAAVPLEEPLHVLLPGGGVQPPDEDAAAAHGWGRERADSVNRTRIYSLGSCRSTI